jgi:hypothetical protein
VLGDASGLTEEEYRWLTNLEKNSFKVECRIEETHQKERIRRKRKEIFKALKKEEVARGDEEFECGVSREEKRKEEQWRGEQRGRKMEFEQEELDVVDWFGAKEQEKVRLEREHEARVEKEFAEMRKMEREREEPHIVEEWEEDNPWAMKVRDILPADEEQQRQKVKEQEEQKDKEQEAQRQKLKEKEKQKCKEQEEQRRKVKEQEEQKGKEQEAQRQKVKEKEKLKRRIQLELQLKEIEQTQELVRQERQRKQEKLEQEEERQRWVDEAKRADEKRRKKEQLERLDKEERRKVRAESQLLKVEGEGEKEKRKNESKRLVIIEEVKQGDSRVVQVGEKERQNVSWEDSEMLRRKSRREEERVEVLEKEMKRRKEEEVEEQRRQERSKEREQERKKENRRKEEERRDESGTASSSGRRRVPVRGGMGRVEMDAARLRGSSELQIDEIVKGIGRETETTNDLRKHFIGVLAAMKGDSGTKKAMTKLFVTARAMSRRFSGMDLHRFVTDILHSGDISDNRLYAARQLRQFALGPGIILDGLAKEEINWTPIYKYLSCWDKTQILEGLGVVIRICGEPAQQVKEEMLKFSWVPSDYFQDKDVEKLFSEERCRRFAQNVCRSFSLPYPSALRHLLWRTLLDQELDAYGRGEVEDEDFLQSFVVICVGNGDVEKQALSRVLDVDGPLGQYVAKMRCPTTAKGDLKLSRKTVCRQPFNAAFHELGRVCGEPRVIEDEVEVRFFAKEVRMSSHITVLGHVPPKLTADSDEIDLVTI